MNNKRVEIPVDVRLLNNLGFVCIDDLDRMKDNGFVTAESLANIRLTLNGVATYLNVSYDRVKRWQRAGQITFDKDGRIGLDKVVLMDWSRVTGEIDGRPRKRTNFTNIEI